MSKKAKAKVEDTKPEQMLLVPRSVIELHWALTNTREWPLSMLVDLSTVKNAYHKAIESAELQEKVSHDPVSSLAAD